MIFDWINAKEAVVFAEAIVCEINRLFPVEDRGGRVRSKKNHNKIDGLILRTRVFAEQYPLNTYKKARFLNTVKWNLKDSGYSEAFISEVVMLLTVALAGR